MFRKALFLLPFFALTSADADARPRLGKHVFHVLVNDVELTDEQKIAFFDMRQNAVEKRQTTVERNRGHKSMISYAKGEISAQEWHDLIDNRATKKLEKRLTRTANLHDILKTYTDEQIEQVKENLSMMNIKQHQKKRMKKRDKGNKMQRLADALELNSSQRALIEELKAHRKAHKEARRDARRAKSERLMSMLDGEMRLNEVERSVRMAHTERIEALHDRADIWIELIDSLNEEQRQTLAKRMGARKGKPHRR